MGVEVVLLADGVVGEGAPACVVAEAGVELGDVLELAQAAVEEHRRDVLEVDAERQPGVVHVVEDGALRVTLGQRPAYIYVTIRVLSHVSTAPQLKNNQLNPTTKEQ
jgi:hypothetical protein